MDACLCDVTQWEPYVNFIKRYYENMLGNELRGSEKIMSYRLRALEHVISETMSNPFKNPFDVIDDTIIYLVQMKLVSHHTDFIIMADIQIDELEKVKRMLEMF